MDPNAALERLRELAKAAFEGDGPPDAQHAIEFAEQFQALDEWIVKSGFLPSDWRR